MIASPLHPSTEALLEWGKSVLMAEDQEQGRRDDLAAQAFAGDLAEDLCEDVARISRDATKALAVLSHPEILDLTEDDAIWDEALEALACLDRVVHLQEAVDGLVRTRNAKLADECLETLRLAYSMASSHFFIHDVSALRLIPLQYLRRQALAALRPDVHYLFPWYNLHNDLEPDILSLLAEHYGHLTEPGRLPVPLQDNLPFFLNEIQTDTVLARYLAKQHAVATSLSNTLQGHWALRLWRAAATLAETAVLSKPIKGHDIASLAQFLLTQATQTMTSAPERLALAVATACFAPGLEDADRCQLLLECEQHNACLADIPAPKSQPEQLVHALNQLKTGKIPAHAAAQVALDFWYSALQSAHASGTKPAGPVNIAELIRALVFDQAARPVEAKPRTPRPLHAPSSWLDRLRDWLFTPTRLVPAMIILLILVTVPTYYLLRDPVPFHVDMTMIAYKTAPLTRSDQDKTVLTLQSGATLSAQDCFQLQFTPTRDVYAYLLHQNTQGMITKYFQGPLVAGNIYQFPEGETRACFTEDSGDEVFYLVSFEERNEKFEEWVDSRFGESFSEKKIAENVTHIFPDAGIEIMSYMYK